MCGDVGVLCQILNVLFEINDDGDGIGDLLNL